ncbi:MAG: MmcQ/YjbR family DNA-binding protein [Candidatus Eremiobacterota bacterium]
MDASEELLSGLRSLCQELPQAEEYVMVHHPAFRAGKKPFVVVGMNSGPTLSVNLGLVEQAELLQDDPRFSRTPYIGQHGWVSMAYADTDWEEITGLVTASYRRVATRRMLRELDSEA